MKVFLLTLCVVGLCVLALCFNIIVRKKDFPHYDVGSNEEMKARGIRCFEDVDAELHGRKCSGKQSEACEGCSLYKK